jgi:hypothetical protein
MAAAAATARPAVLRHAGGLAVTAAFDPANPNMARVYDHLLGGKDALPADRGQAGRLVDIYPPLRDVARENRAFIIRAAAWAAGQGISQVIDLGAGLPASPSVHQAIREVLPTARVAYIDIDPVVLSHARALLATRDGVTAVAADLSDPEAVFADQELRAIIDPAWPVCVILGAVLHFMHADAARTVATGYTSLMAPGSCLVISVASFDDEGPRQAAGRGVHRRTVAQSFGCGRRIVLRRAGHGGARDHRGAELAALDVRAGLPAP